MSKVKFVFHDAQNVVSFEIYGIKQDITFASTDQLSQQHLANNIILGVQDGDIYFDHDSEAFKSLSQKYDEELLTIFVGALAMPTFSYGSRVMLSQTPFISFMDKVISAYAASIKPMEPKKFFSVFMSAKKKRRYEYAKEKYERISKIEACDISCSLQNFGIISHDPYGNFDGLVINVGLLQSNSQLTTGYIFEY